MCECCGCTNPDKEEKKPEECTPERTSQCHPDVEEHPCEEKKQDD